MNDPLADRYFNTIQDMVNRDKHIWEGWTVGDFIDDVEVTFNMCARS